jgi:hypothetical protein
MTSYIQLFIVLSPIGDAACKYQADRIVSMKQWADYMTA